MKGYEAQERLEAIVKERQREIAEALRRLKRRVEFAGVTARRFGPMVGGLDIQDRLHLPVAVKVWSWKSKPATRCDDRWYVGVVGNTYPIKDGLRDAGYRFWNLVEPAWIRSVAFDPADPESVLQSLRRAVEIANETFDLLARLRGAK